MTFEKEFDEIVIDLCGVLPEKEQEEDSRDSYFHFQQLTELQEHYGKLPEREPIDWIRSNCREHIHKCHCGLDYKLYIYQTIRPRIKSWAEEFDVRDVVDYVKKRYHCFLCGDPFYIVNGDVLRIELRDEDTKSYLGGRN